MAETINSQINVVSQIRDFVKSFRLQEITIKEFLAGPLISSSTSRETEADIFEEFLSELDELIDFDDE